MAGFSLECRDCGAQLRTVEEAQEHAEVMKHTNFAESTTPVLNLVCNACTKPCRSQTERDLHTKRTGHTEFSDKTAEAAKPVVLESKPASVDEAMADASDQQGGEPADLVVPEVNKDLLAELESMGFPMARAVRALHFSGSSSIEQAVNWIVDHEEDPDIDELPKVPVNDPAAAAATPPLTPEETRIRAQGLIEKARKKKEEEEKRLEREREKERIRIGRELLEAKRIEEDNERKRVIALRKAEKEEEKRARERIRQKLEEDRAERRRKLGLPPEESKPADPPEPHADKETKKSFLPVRPATKAEEMRDCLRSMKQIHKEDDAKVKKAFQTLLTYVGNIARFPNEEKYRKIRLQNPSFQERVGSIDGGIRFLEICGFEMDAAGEFIYLALPKVDPILLNAAGAELNSAISNPFFGVL